MNRSRTALLAATFISMGFFETHAGGPGTTTAPFIGIPMSGRTAAMGGSIAPTWGDASAIESNPAAICGLDRVDLQASYLKYLEDTGLEAVTLGVPFSVGGRPDVLPLDQDDYWPQKLYVGVHYRLFETNDTTRSNVGATGDDFEIRDNEIQTAVAYPFSQRLALGVGIKRITQSLDNQAVTNLAGDAGLLYRFNNHWTASGVLQNLGSSATFLQDAVPLPTQGRLGLAWQQGPLLLLAEGVQGRDNILQSSTGIEWSLNRWIKFRGGVSRDTTVEFSGGLGIQISGPQKFAAPPNATPSTSYRSPSDNAALMEKCAQRITDRLTRQYLEKTSATKSPTVAVFSLASENEKPGSVLGDLLSNQFMQSQHFFVVERTDLLDIFERQKIQPTGALNPSEAAQLGKIMKADFVIMGTINKSNSRYAIHAQLIDTRSAEIVADTTDELPGDVFQSGERAPLGQTTSGSRPKLASTSSPAERSGFSSVDIGLDYGLSTRSDLGLIHTFSIRILY